jgi:hypothetical protein
MEEVSLFLFGTHTLWRFGIFVGYLVYVPSLFGILVLPRKSGNSVPECSLSNISAKKLINSHLD